MTRSRNKPRPQLVFSTAPFFRYPVREAFRHAADAGFEAVEVMVNQDPHTQEPHLLAPLAKEFGISVAAIHAPFLLLTRRVWGPEPTGKIYRAVHLAEELGSPLVVIHPPYRWQVRFRGWVQDQLADFSERTGVTIAVENMFSIRLSGERGVRLHAGEALDDLERVPYLVLDTSHAAVEGIDIREFYRRNADRVRHVHLSNNAGKGWDSHLPVDQEGVLPLGEFLGDLTNDGFAGNVSLELDLRRWMQDADGLQGVLNRNREFCQRQLAPAKTSPH